MPLIPQRLHIPIPRSARKVLTRQDRGVKNRMPASSLVGLGIFSRPIRKANARADLYPRSVKILSKKSFCL